MLPVWQIILLASALIFALISIFLWIWNVVRAKKMREKGFISKKNKTKKIKLPIKLDKFIAIFGGIENIVSTKSTSNKIQIKVINHDKINFNELKKIKNDGILDQSDGVSIVLGNYVNNLSHMINDLISLNKNKNAIK